MVLFTLPLPFYWALTLASPWRRGTSSAIAAGTLLLALLALAATILDVAITFVANTHLLSSPVWIFLLSAVSYAEINVMPYLAPVLLAVATNSELRRLVLAPFAVPASSVPAGSAWRAVPSGPKKRRPRVARIAVQ